MICILSFKSQREEKTFRILREQNVKLENEKYRKKVVAFFAGFWYNQFY